MIQIVFRSVACQRCETSHARWRRRAPPRYHVTAEVVSGTTQVTTPVGPGVDFESGHAPITLDEAAWTFENTRPTSLWAGFPFVIVVRVRDAHGVESTGRIRVPRPIQETWTLDVGDLAVVVQMRLPVRGRNGSYRGADGRFNYGDHPPDHVFLFRTNGDEYQSVHMEWRHIRAEINPVFLDDFNRIDRPAWTLTASRWDNLPPDLTTNLAPNAVVNPPVVPLIESPTAAQAAIVQITRAFGPTLTLGDARLRWRVDPSSDGEVQLVGSPATRDRGTRVQVAGTREGDVKLELLFNEFPIASYRALVRPIVRIPYRVIVFEGASSGVLSTADVTTDLLVANVALRQLALELVPEPSRPRVSHPEVTNLRGDILAPGIFRVTVPPRLTVDVTEAISDEGSLVGAEPNIVNIVYVASRSPSETWGGRACHFPESLETFGTITDTGAPSTAWLDATGIPPSTTPYTARMSLFPAILSSRSNPIYGIVMVAFGFASSVERGTSLAHELGHTLNLLHRRHDADGLPELNHNIMHFHSGHGPSFDSSSRRAPRGGATS